MSIYLHIVAFLMLCSVDAEFLKTTPQRSEITERNYRINELGEAQGARLTKFYLRETR